MQTPRIADITGTFGAEHQNGVARFHAGLFEWSRQHGLPLEVYSAGDHLAGYDKVNNIHAVSFRVPEFPTLDLYYPLEGRRRQLQRTLKRTEPDIVLVATPDPIGFAGLTAALELEIPLSGIYHTDFPDYARQSVRAAVERFLSLRDSLGLPSVLAAAWPLLRGDVQALMTEEEQGQFRALLAPILVRGRRHIDRRIAELADGLGKIAQATVREALLQFYGRFQMIVARSQSSRQAILDELELPLDRVRTLQAGVDVDRFSPQGEATDSALYERLGVARPGQVVLYVGRISDEKNADFLADAWRAYRVRNPQSDVTFVVVGSGDTRRFAERAGEGVRAVGAMHGADLHGLYRRADVFWSASITETLGQVVLEAQASGVPTIVANRGAPREYVFADQTGLILGVDDPQRWARALEQLLASNECRRQMGAMARQRMVSQFSIDASYRHFWQLHCELHERCQISTGKIGALPIRISKNEPPPAPSKHPRSVYLSDFHAGKAHPHKQSALEVILSRARHNRATVCLNGDFLDTRPDLKKMHADIKMLRRALERHDISPALYVEGNHDYEFARAGTLAEYVRTWPAPSLVAIDSNGVVVTHGHISEVPELPNILRTARSQREILEALSVPRLKDRLKRTAVEYDLSGLFTKYLEDVGLDGLEDLWRHILPQRQRLVEALTSAARHRGIEMETFNAVLHMLGHRDRERVLAQLGVALEGWALVYGHTHEPGLAVLEATAPHSQESRAILVGNSGSFRRKSIPPTWLEAQFPYLELWAYDPEKDDAVLVDRVGLPLECDATRDDCQAPRVASPEIAATGA